MNNKQTFKQMKQQLENAKQDLIRIENKHIALREILIKYNNVEFGDCIINEISSLFGYPTTNIYYDE